MKDIIKNTFKNKTIILLGASGGIGRAVSQELILKGAKIISNSSRNRSMMDNLYHFDLDLSDEVSWDKFSKTIKERFGKVDGVINCLGLLHEAGIAPEKTYKHYKLSSLEKVFTVNTYSMCMSAKYFLPLMNLKEEGFFVGISAKVGSLSDNKIGGWGAYRASKAATNMILKNLQIELARKKSPCMVLAIHPGTTHTDLSSPFTKHITHKIHTPLETAQNILSVIEGSSCEDEIFKNWDGTNITF